jgi:hypothetical protein
MQVFFRSDAVPLRLQNMRYDRGCEVQVGLSAASDGLVSFTSKCSAWLWLGIRELSLESAYATPCANASSSSQNCTEAYEVVPRHLVSCEYRLLRVSRVNCQEVARRWKESRHTSRCLLLVMENGDRETQVTSIQGPSIRTRHPEGSVLSVLRNRE